MPISLCMIVKDEEKFLEKALNSVKSIANEIIIVDTGSKDHTKSIARKFTKKIYNFKWKHDFAAARNFSIKKAKKDWILILDADETISKNDLKKIKKLIGNWNSSIMGYSFVQRTYSNKKSGLKWNPSANDAYSESKNFPGWNYRGITRLFKNGKRIKFSHPVHETVVDSIKKINGKIKQTSIPIHHFEVLKEKGFNIKKSCYYAELLKNKVKKCPKAKFYFELALELEKSGKKGAKKYFKKAAGLNPHHKQMLVKV